jgi:hypothetical protein
MAKVGDKYTLFGTDNVFEITGDGGDNWVIKIIVPPSVEVGVLMNKIDLNDSVNQGTFELQ